MENVPWKPFREIVPFRKEMDNLFKRFFGESPLAEVFAEQWLPAMDVSETEDMVLVKAELPGLEVSDIEVSMLGDRLMIKGEKKKEAERTGEHYHSSERYYGAFQRSFQLPATVKIDQVEAKFDKGILTITLPKTEEAKTKEVKIPVR